MDFNLCLFYSKTYLHKWEKSAVEITPFTALSLYLQYAKFNLIILVETWGIEPQS